MGPLNVENKLQVDLNRTKTKEYFKATNFLRISIVSTPLNSIAFSGSQ